MKKLLAIGLVFVGQLNFAMDKASATEYKKFKFTDDVCDPTNEEYQNYLKRPESIWPQKHKDSMRVLEDDGKRVSFEKLKKEICGKSNEMSDFNSANIVINRPCYPADDTEVLAGRAIAGQLKDLPDSFKDLANCDYPKEERPWVQRFLPTCCLITNPLQKGILRDCIQPGYSKNTYSYDNIDSISGSCLIALPFFALKEARYYQSVFPMILTTPFVLIAGVVNASNRIFNNSRIQVCKRVDVDGMSYHMAPNVYNNPTNNFCALKSKPFNPETLQQRYNLDTGKLEPYTKSE